MSVGTITQTVFWRNGLRLSVLVRSVRFAWISYRKRFLECRILLQLSLWSRQTSSEVSYDLWSTTRAPYVMVDFLSDFLWQLKCILAASVVWYKWYSILSFVSSSQVLELMLVETITEFHSTRYSHNSSEFLRISWTALIRYDTVIINIFRYSITYHMFTWSYKHNIVPLC